MCEDGPPVFDVHAPYVRHLILINQSRYVFTTHHLRTRTVFAATPQGLPFHARRISRKPYGIINVFDISFFWSKGNMTHLELVKSVNWLPLAVLYHRLAPRRATLWTDCPGRCCQGYWSPIAAPQPTGAQTRRLSIGVPLVQRSQRGAWAA